MNEVDIITEATTVLLVHPEVYTEERRTIFNPISQDKHGPCYITAYVGNGAGGFNYGTVEVEDLAWRAGRVDIVKAYVESISYTRLEQIMTDLQSGGSVALRVISKPRH